MKDNRITIKLILVCMISIASIFLLGFNITKNKTPNEMYAVYLQGKKIGTVKSKEEFNKYINQQEEKLKEQFNVDTIHTPKGVEIKKIVTYSTNTNTNEEIYNKLVKSENFTIEGIVLEITKENTEENKLPEITTINLLNKELFDEAIVDIIKAFIDDQEYEKFMNSTQEEITNTGEIIEDIYIKENITYKEDYIPTSEKIFTDVNELTKYLMYGTTESQSTYIVKEGDTIETIAEKNKLNVQEFLIANPEFTSANNLLYESQEVLVGLIDPIISIVVEKHAVKEEPKKYITEIKYDENLIIGYSYTEREGEDGLELVTRKYQYINGQIADVALMGSVEIKPSLNTRIYFPDKSSPVSISATYFCLPFSIHLNDMILNFDS